MSVLNEEPDEYIDAMYAVLERRAEAQIYGADSVRWDE